MRLKYAKHHKICKPCPPRTVQKPGLKHCFRLVTCPTPGEEEFIPPAVMDPSRNFNSAALKCSAYALSLFTQENEARAHHKKLAKQVKKFRELKVIAKVSLTPSDGFISPPNSKGHLNLHESEHCQLHLSVVGTTSA